MIRNSTKTTVDKSAVVKKPANPKTKNETVATKKRKVKEMAAEEEHEVKAEDADENSGE